MLPKTIESYGGPYVDREVLKNPESQVAADKGNRVFEDVAQLTRTSVRAMVHFHPGASDPAVLWHWSLWGSSNTERPTITRSSAGRYTVTYPATLTDALGVDETVAFLSGVAGIWSSNNDDVKITSLAVNAIQLFVRNAAGSANDLTGAETITLWLR